MSDLINISFGDAALTALLGYLVVFFGLVLLMVVVIIMGKIMVSRACRPCRVCRTGSRSSCRSRLGRRAEAV